MSTDANTQLEGSTVISTPDDKNWTYFLPGRYSWSRQFWMSDSDFWMNNKEEYFKYLKDLHEGKRNGPSWRNDGAYAREDNRHLIATYASQLELTDYQADDADSYFCSFNLREWGIRKSLVAYSVCAYVVKNDDRNKTRKTHPNVPEDERDGLFVQLAHELNITNREFEKTYGKVQAKVREYSRPPILDRGKDFDPGGGGLKP